MSCNDIILESKGIYSLNALAHFDEEELMTEQDEPIVEAFLRAFAGQ